MFPWTHTFPLFLVSLFFFSCWGTWFEIDVARACAVVCVYSSGTMLSSFPSYHNCLYCVDVGCFHTFSPRFLWWVDAGHIACVRRASRIWSGTCFLLLPSFPLVSAGCLDPFASTYPSGWRWVRGIGCLKGLWLLFLSEGFFCVCLGHFSGVNSCQYFLFGLFGVRYVLSASLGIYLYCCGCVGSLLPSICLVVCISLVISSVGCSHRLSLWLCFSRDLVPWLLCWVSRWGSWYFLVGLDIMFFWSPSV